jgi:hypothetical protein
MTGAPAVSWFRPNPGRHSWIPIGDRYQTVVGTPEPDAKFLGSIPTGRLLEAVQVVLSAGKTAKRPTA